MTALPFKPIAIEDKKIFDNFFSVYSPKISEYTFTNLFIWSDVKNIKYCIYKNGLLMIAVDKNDNSYFLPPVGFRDCQDIFDFIVEYGSKNNIKLIKLIPEYQKKFVKRLGIKVIADRNSFDYVYKTELLATLKGWRLDGKRGFLKKFKEKYSYRYLPYTNLFKDACLKLFKKWIDNKNSLDPSVEDEFSAFKKFLNYFSELNAVGGIIIVDEKVIAFSFGEKLDENTFVIHFEKADSSYIGSYQTINQLFVQTEVYGKYPFVNREQDMGIEGIRKAKMSYAPFKLLKKYTASF